ncbi:TIGR01777 family oxidoreductase [soil metagenome]
MNGTVLITGGSGLIGNKLTQFLQEIGYSITHLSRSKKGDEKIKTYFWDLDQEEIEIEALTTADHIIHLAGANLAEKRWTEKQKKIIIESRTKSADLLLKKLAVTEHKVKSFISASGIGIYGSDNSGHELDEHSPPGEDFLSEVTVKWEEAVDRISTLGIRVVKLRTGLVLTTEGGALPKLMLPVKFGVGAALGSGKQVYSWIHIEDLCRIYLQAIENESMNGPYNAVAPEPVTNQEFTRSLANVLNRPLLLPKIPRLILNIILGEMAIAVVGGNKITSRKIENTGFQFNYNNLDAALTQLLK